VGARRAPQAPVDDQGRGARDLDRERAVQGQTAPGPRVRRQHDPAASDGCGGQAGRAGDDVPRRVRVGTSRVRAERGGASGQGAGGVGGV
jgi:hypothetical protein